MALAIHEQWLGNPEMRISILNFCSIKKAILDISPGVNILSGKNGSGKSQILMAIAHQYGNNLLLQYGFDSSDITPKSVMIEPRPKKVLWRPPVRKLGEASRGQKYATLGPTHYLNLENNSGYTFNVDDRYTQLHNRLANVYVAGNIMNSTAINSKIWKDIQESFRNVFSKELDGEFTLQGGRVGLKLDNSHISNFSTLSTGEQEFAGLLCDLLTEPGVDFFLIDEIDTHFHPDLQVKIIDEITKFIGKRTLLATTHSPYVMLSALPGALYYLRHSSEVNESVNQISRLSQDYELATSLMDIYGDFGKDSRLSRHFLVAANSNIIAYADECLKDSTALPVDTSTKSDSDPQISALRHLVLGLSPGSNIIEIGAGKGRLLTAFRKLSVETKKNISYTAVEMKEEYLAELINFSAISGLKDQFRSFNAISGLGQVSIDFQYDLCILANILHEIAPLSLPIFLNSIFKMAKPNSTILLLEALELPIGERNFVSYSQQSLNLLFEKLLQNNLISLNSASPCSFNGTPLLEMVIRTANPTSVLITIDDVKSALMSLSNELESGFCENIDKRIFTGRQLAFRCHNLANVRAFLMKLSNP